MSFEQVIKLWEIKDERLEEISKEKLDFENRLEDWLEADISILSPYLLVIGKQVPTDFGGYVDLLCLEEDGDLVVVELKRDRTPREVTAQTIDYASWVNDLTGERARATGIRIFSSKTRNWFWFPPICARHGSILLFRKINEYMFEQTAINKTLYSVDNNKGDSALFGKGID